MEPSRLAARVAEVRERIAAAQERGGWSSPVTLVAVTKTHPPALITAVREAGISEIGENRVPELEEKVGSIGRDSVRWHLVGRLQRNKVRRALSLFDLFHSVDSIRLAEKLSSESVAAGAQVEALAQVNTSGEQAKAGYAPDEALDALAEICALPGLRISGLMTMAPLTEDERVLRATFRRARALWDAAARDILDFDAVHLSMGMSNDFEIAVEEGSTLVRLGTVLFGERDT